jgi:cell division protein FtsN
MLKFVKLNITLSFFAAFLLIWGCSSGEYEINRYKVSYEEKILKVDTIRNVTIKEDFKETTKDSYNFSVQIGAFVNPANFDRFIQRAKELLGSSVYYEQTANLYKVRVGNFSVRAEAIKFLEFAKTKGYFDAFVISKKK